MAERSKFLSYPYVVSTLALIIACSGGAYAAGLAKNSVTTKQLAPGAVHAGDIKKDAVTGKAVKESTLEKVPSAANADRLGGTAAGGFVASNRIMSGKALQALGIEDELFSWPEAGWKLVGDGNGTYTGFGVKVVANEGTTVSVYDMSGDSAGVATTGFPYYAQNNNEFFIVPSDRSRITHVTCTQTGDAPVYAYCFGIRSQ